MLNHERIWRAIDELARANDLSPSGLAKRAGLDSTTFNKSKRFSNDGRARWPSTESIAKVLSATGVETADFLALGAENGRFAASAGSSAAIGMQESATPFQGRSGTIPLIGMAQAGGGGFFDDAGFPRGEGWEMISLPAGEALGEHVYALEISGDSMLPLYRPGDRIVIAPDQTVRVGDKIVARTAEGEVMAKVLRKRNTRTIILGSLNPDYPDLTFDVQDLEWMARIVWASQ